MKPFGFTAKEAAALLKVSTATLRNWRHELDGPRYTKFSGKIYYSSEDLLHWIKIKKKFDALSKKIITEAQRENDDGCRGGLLRKCTEGGNVKDKGCEE